VSEPITHVTSRAVTQNLLAASSQDRNLPWLLPRVVWPASRVRPSSSRARGGFPRAPVPVCCVLRRRYCANCRWKQQRMYQHQVALVATKGNIICGDQLATLWTKLFSARTRQTFVWWQQTARQKVRKKTKQSWALNATTANGVYIQKISMIRLRIESWTKLKTWAWNLFRKQTIPAFFYLRGRCNGRDSITFWCIEEQAVSDALIAKVLRCTVSVVAHLSSTCKGNVSESWVYAGILTCRLKIAI